MRTAYGLMSAWTCIVFALGWHLKPSDIPAAFVSEDEQVTCWFKGGLNYVTVETKAPLDPNSCGWREAAIGKYVCENRSGPRITCDWNEGRGKYDCVDRNGSRLSSVPWSRPEGK